MATKKSVRTAINEFQREVHATLYQQVIITHPKTVHRTIAARTEVVAARVPQQCCRFRTGIGGRDRRKREDAMAVFTPACGNRRNQSVFNPGQKPGTFTAIINRVLAEDLRKCISRALGDEVNSKVTSHSSSVGIPTLSPVWWDTGIVWRGIGGLGLLDSSDRQGTKDGIGSERIECIILQFFLFGRAMVGGSRAQGARRRRRSSLHGWRLSLTLRRSTRTARGLAPC